MSGKSSVLYPNHYAWYLLAGTLDILVTFIIVEHFGGGEANAVARHLLERFGWAALIVLKYATVTVVVLVCELVGRRQANLGRLLATSAVVVSAMPVGLGLAQVWAWTHHAAWGATRRPRSPPGCRSCEAGS